ncbi:septal ring lytic transglycosylase RlpA family protein [Candidatus Omnitrophota bacterium]
MKVRIIRLLFIIFIISIFMSPKQNIRADIGGRPIVGVASWYAEFSPGINKTTANMEIFDHDGMTCAIWRIPFDTILKVTNLENSKAVYVRVNDRGPAKRLVEDGRVIDLTRRSFEKIEDLDKGLAKVKVEVISHPR